MVDLPAKSDLERALVAASAFHEEYERAALGGVVDERWAGFCAAFVLGRLGDFSTASRLAQLLEEVSEGEEWAAEAAEHIVTKLRS